MNINIVDSKGNGYREIRRGSEFIRVTAVKDGFTGTPAIGIQVRQEDGHLRSGPEIPLAQIGGVIGAIVALLSEESNS